MCEGNQLLISQRNHTHSIRSNQKMWLGFFSFILKTKHKTLHVKWAWVELEEFYRKTFCSSFNRSSLILDRLSQTELHSKFYINSIPTLHKMHILQASINKTKTCFDHGLPTIQIRVLIYYFLILRT